jgi:hypothetical protein
MSNNISTSTIVLVFMIVAVMLSISTLAQASPPELLEQKKAVTLDSNGKEAYGYINTSANTMIHLPLVLRNANLEPPWTVIESQDFEGPFPSAGWVLGTDTGGKYLWAKRTCRPYEGDYSAWAVGGGPSGSGLSCGSDYPDNAITWMDYGPFDLSDATAAEMQFKFWANTEDFFDELCWLVSKDYSTWDGVCGSGVTIVWFDRVFDLADYRGESQVWISFEIESDIGTNKIEGAFVDDIEIRKCIHASCANPTSANQIPAQDGFITYKKSFTR